MTGAAYKKHLKLAAQVRLKQTDNLSTCKKKIKLEKYVSEVHKWV